MKTLKLAVTGAVAVGVITAGGVTYANVGNSTPTAAEHAAKKAPVKVVHQPAAPSVLPQCDIKPPKAGTPDKGKLPHCKAGKLPKAPGGLPKAPGKPGLPKLPKPGKLSCSSVPPVIQKSDSRTLHGMHLTYSHSVTVTVQSRKFCGSVQKWAGAAKQQLTLERLNTPPQVTLQELAAALHTRPGSMVTVGGTQAWQTPLGDETLMYSPQGYAVYVAGNPAMAGQLREIVAGLKPAK